MHQGSVASTAVVPVRVLEPIVPHAPVALDRLAALVAVRLVHDRYKAVPVTDGAVARLAAHCAGMPHAMPALCRAAAFLASVERSPQVTADHVDCVVAIRDGRPIGQLAVSSECKRRWRWAAPARPASGRRVRQIAAASAVALAAAAWPAYRALGPREGASDLRAAPSPALAEPAPRDQAGILPGAAPPTLPGTAATTVQPASDAAATAATSVPASGDPAAPVARAMPVTAVSPAAPPAAEAAPAAPAAAAPGPAEPPPAAAAAPVLDRAPADLPGPLPSLAPPASFAGPAPRPAEAAAEPGRQVAAVRSKKRPVRKRGHPEVAAIVADSPPEKPPVAVAAKPAPGDYWIGRR